MQARNRPVNEPESIDQLWPELYDRLRRLAEARIAHEPPGNSVQASDLVHEAYLRLKNGKTGDGGPRWESRAQFFNAVAETMRRVLVDAARKRRSLKRGGDLRRLPLQDDRVTLPSDPELILSIDEVLTALAGVDEKAAAIIRLHYFTGLSIDEVAETLEISRSQAYRQWEFARAWLFDALGRSP